MRTSIATPAERDQQFLRMLAAFRRSGGLNRGHEVGSWLEGSRRHDVGTLERWMAHDDVIHFEWQQQTWLPMFQFDLTAATPRVAVGLVLIEFNGALPNWDIAQWFAAPNSGLDGNRPADLLGADPGLVIDAARHERRLMAHLDA